MATDIFIRNGLNSRQMAEIAQKYRHEFDVAHVELVDVIEILEFKMRELFPGFHIVIKVDAEVNGQAFSDPKNKRIVIRESIYNSACEGDAGCRFVIAHEIGHYILHASKNKTLHKTIDTYDAAIRGMNSTESAEAQADMFARHFLAPPFISYALRSDIQSLSRRTGIPLNIAKGNVTLSRRIEMRDLATTGPIKR
ncbi:ImmA/IrrE family metallo-endopeptidase [Neorhizobium sp. T25_27]|uniref:ImmA/IrrE family metallo-endopeptidase n=1 Tax=Neorhizobium sp. T25_27 TaxID=2093831 RepID=UPI000CF8DAD9|nr:ImmA/IrrE family metallo-endopeptidase [Neorhizobium sp. T25_27]